MIRALLLRNLRQHGILLAAIWAGLLLWELIIVWVAARIDTGLGIRSLMEMLVPPDVRDTLLSQLGLASFPGAITFGFQHPFTLVATLAFLITAATIPSSERETGLMDVLLARPVPRWRYFLACGLVVLIAALVLPLALLAGAAIGMAIVEGPGELPWTEYIPSAVTLCALLLAAGGYTLLLTSDAPRRGTAVARTVGITLLFFWLDFMGSYWEALDLARWITPFAYFDPAGTISNGGLPVRDLCVLLLVFALSTTGAFFTFRRQDL